MSPHFAASMCLVVSMMLLKPGASLRCYNCTATDSGTSCNYFSVRYTGSLGLQSPTCYVKPFQCAKITKYRTEDGDMLLPRTIDAFCASEEYVAANKPGCTTTVTVDEIRRVKVSTRTCIEYCATNDCNDPFSSKAN